MNNLHTGTCFNLMIFSGYLSFHNFVVISNFHNIWNHVGLECKKYLNLAQRFSDSQASVFQAISESYIYVKLLSYGKNSSLQNWSSSPGEMPTSLLRITVWHSLLVRKKSGTVTKKNKKEHDSYFENTCPPPVPLNWE